MTEAIKILNHQDKAGSNCALMFNAQVCDRLFCFLQRNRVWGRLTLFSSQTMIVLMTF